MLLLKISLIFYFEILLFKSQVYSIDEDIWDFDGDSLLWVFRAKRMFEATGILPEFIDVRVREYLHNPFVIGGEYKNPFQLKELDDTIRPRVPRNENDNKLTLCLEMEVFEGETNCTDIYYHQKHVREYYDHNNILQKHIWYELHEMKPRARRPHNKCKFFLKREQIYLIQMEAKAEENMLDRGPLNFVTDKSSKFKFEDFAYKFQYLRWQNGNVLAFVCDDTKTKEIKEYFLIGVIVLCVIGLLMGIYSVIREIYSHKYNAH